MYNTLGNLSKTMKRRQQSIHERLVREFHREKHEAIAKCKLLGITYYEVGKNDAELYATPSNFVCIASSNECAIGDEFVEGAPEESVYITQYDYETYDLF